MFQLFQSAERATSQREQSLAAEVERLKAELANERAAHEQSRRELRISAAEVESLALVIARDRARIQAETAAYAAERATAEGANSVRRA